MHKNDSSHGVKVKKSARKAFTKCKSKKYSHKKLLHCVKVFHFIQKPILRRSDANLGGLAGEKE